MFLSQFGPFCRYRAGDRGLQMINTQV